MALLISKQHPSGYTASYWNVPTFTYTTTDDIYKGIPLLRYQVIGYKDQAAYDAGADPLAIRYISIVITSDETLIKTAISKSIPEVIMSPMDPTKEFLPQIYTFLKTTEYFNGATDI
jgi:hypothetical protein